MRSASASWFIQAGCRSNISCHFKGMHCAQKDSRATGDAAGEFARLRYYRLLHEYFAFPDRFRFFSMNGLRRLQPMEGPIRDCLPFLQKQANSALEPLIDTDNFASTAPVVNLFQHFYRIAYR